jgi:toxin ParE1/3/4
VTAKPVVPRALARRDVQLAADWYAGEAGEDVALRFIDAVETAYRAIAGNPATGSPRFAHELNLPGLRSRSLEHYPWLVFYMERDDHVDIWRVLHARRDIPATIQKTEL